MERHFVSRNPAVDVLFSLLEADLRRHRMRPFVVREGVVLRGQPRELGNWADDLPTRKNVARMHLCARRCQIFSVCGGRGPSSKVSTISHSAKGAV
ncbi:hypothetical protein [Bradyrhizobium sp. S3.2.12]|uniref:hypothetical protein n=1 Tax=Bradyrhizobium sp. S3.2.12 TaxID=3156387 RepID=UPI0033990817